MKKIVLIEDDLPLSQIYKELFTAEGFEVTVATNGPSGFLQVKNVIPNLVILDVMLPGGVNGFDILQDLKADQALAKIPVIILTNLDNERQTAMSLGAVDYIVKANVEIPEIVKLIKKYIR